MKGENDRVIIMTRAAPAKRRELRVIAARNDLHITDIVEFAIDELLKRYKETPTITACAIVAWRLSKWGDNPSKGPNE